MSVLIDISWPLSGGSVSYKDRHPLVIEQLRSVAVQGVQDSLCSRLHMHAGTHVDAPSHFIDDGQQIEQLSLAQMNGPCRVLDLTRLAADVDSIAQEDIASFAIAPGERILFKTRNSLRAPFGTYNQGEVFLAASAARYLADRGVALVGIDALGLERNQPGYASHMALFNAGAIIVEGLRLGGVPSGRENYWLHLLPLAFVGTEAAPARAVLTEG